MDLPQNIAIAPCEAIVTQAQANEALLAVGSRMAGTKFTSAAPARLQGLVELELKNGGRMYTDCRGQYVILGLLFDLNSRAEQLSGHDD
jgi:hypothetical protein